MIAVMAEEMEGGLQYKLGDGALVLGAVLPEPDGMVG
jgi:histidine phosphotransferase ChpT